MGAILALRVYAALDAPRDSVHSLFVRANRLLERSVPVAERAAMRRRVFATPIVLATEDLGAEQVAPLAGTDDLLAMRAALVAGNPAAARAAGSRFAAMASSYSPGTVGPDRLTAYASMLLASGDSLAAARELDAAIYAIPRARRILLEATPQAAVIGRALLQRAQLAARIGDRATARRLLGDVDTLWRGADVDVRAPIEVLKRQLVPPR